jgi:hypothetical protein
VATSNDLCDDDGEQHECVNALRRCELFFNACTISDSYEFFILVCVCCTALHTFIVSNASINFNAYSDFLLGSSVFYYTSAREQRFQVQIYI